MAMRVEEILSEVKKDKRWILKVINSCESADQLKSCYNIIKSWSNKIKGMIEQYNCPFYKYNEMKKIQTIYRSLESRLYCEVDRKIVEDYELIEN
jgi:hypothetical protein